MRSIRTNLRKNQAFRMSSMNSLSSMQTLWKEGGFINGEYRMQSSTGKTFEVLNPANGQVIGKLPRMGVKEVQESSQIAYDTWQSWKNTTAKDRAKILSRMAVLMEKYRNDLAKIITLESGKPIAEALGEITYAISFYEFYAEEAKRIMGDVLQSPVRGRQLLAIKQPVGPAALITPWNFPCAMITRKVGPALAAGCTVVIKPSEETPYSALALCAIAEEAGLPKGVMNCLTVGREEVQEVGLALCHNTLLRKVSFTGSTAVGKWLMRESSETVKKISLELGGNAPFIIFDDADLNVAVRALLASKFRNAGQACIASNRILVQEGVYEEFASMLSKEVSKIKCGNGLEKDITMGPLINAKGLAKVVSQVQDCVAKGANVIEGGTVNSTLNQQGGCFFNPTVLTGVTKDMLPFVEETFGPLVPLMSFKTEEEAIAIANDTRYGLAGYFCTKDLARAWRVSEALEFGMVGVNEGAISCDIAPFGGVKESGLGREGGYYGIEEYLEVKYVCMGLGK